MAKVTHGGNPVKPKETEKDRLIRENKELRAINSRQLQRITDMELAITYIREELFSMYGSAKVSPRKMLRIQKFDWSKYVTQRNDREPRPWDKK
jgi:hypothetical protein